MSQFKDETQQVIDRLMNLQRFTVSVPVEENWMPNGVVPFDIRIKNGIATVTVPALTEAEARSKIIAYFNSSEDDDDGV
jgi:hypothetical protein